MTLPRQTPRHASAAPARHAALDLLVERLYGTDEQVRPTALRELGVLADTTPDLRGDVVRVVCEFLRGSWTARGRDLGRGAHPGEPELRRAAVRLLAEHLRQPSSATTWTGHDLDLAGAVLVGADFSGCSFIGGRVRFEGAWCIEGRMSFAGARFLGAEVSFRHWSSGQGRLGFEGARFSAGVVTLAGASIDADTVSLAGAVVDGGVFALTEARMRAGVIDLTGISVSAGTLSFADARLAAGRVLLVDARLLGGLTALRDVRLGAGVLSTAGAQARPGALDLRGTEVEDGPAGAALLRLAGAEHAPSANRTRS